MATWTPDPSFYPSPRMARKAAPETLAYVGGFDPDRKAPDAITVVDVDPRSNSYSTIIGSTPIAFGERFSHAKRWTWSLEGEGPGARGGE
jgi:56kDa selenium binding protein (SBP56)